MTIRDKRATRQREKVSPEPLSSSSIYLWNSRNKIHSRRRSRAAAVLCAGLLLQFYANRLVRSSKHFACATASGETEGKKREFFPKAARSSEITRLYVDASKACTLRIATMKCDARVALFRHTVHLAFSVCFSPNIGCTFFSTSELAVCIAELSRIHRCGSGSIMKRVIRHFSYSYPKAHCTPPANAYCEKHSHIENTVGNKSE